MLFQCLPSQWIFDYFNQSAATGLNEATFRQLSVILVSFMYNLTGECANSPNSIQTSGQTLDEFKDALLAISDGHGHDHDHQTDHVITEEHLETIIHEMEENFRVGSLVLDGSGVINQQESGKVDYTKEIQVTFHYCFT